MSNTENKIVENCEHLQSTIGKILPGPVVIITGPTASGKSSIALKLAEIINGEIVCADSMQIYQDINIGTAKPTSHDIAKIKHHLFSMISPEDTFSVASYVNIATHTIRGILEDGKIPILCGGTGQYISALIDGIEFIPVETNIELRERLAHEAEVFGIKVLMERLEGIDPKAAAQLSMNDVKRIIRALEVYELTGLTKTQINQKSREKGPDFRFLSFCINVERTNLYNNIDKRVDQMMDAGLLEEVQNIRCQYPNRSKTAKQAIGYKELEEYLDEKVTYEEAINNIKQASRNYAKRQMTWFRRVPSLTWIDHNNLVETVNRIVMDIQLIS